MLGVWVTQRARPEVTPRPFHAGGSWALPGGLGPIPPRHDVRDKGFSWCSGLGENFSQLNPAPSRRPSALPRRVSPRSRRGCARQPRDCGEHERGPRRVPLGNSWPGLAVPGTQKRPLPDLGRFGRGRAWGRALRQYCPRSGPGSGCGARPRLVPRPPGAVRRRSQEGGRPRRGRAEQGGPRRQDKCLEAKTAQRSGTGARASADGWQRDPSAEPRRGRAGEARTSHRRRPHRSASSRRALRSVDSEAAAEGRRAGAGAVGRCHVPQTAASPKVAKSPRCAARHDRRCHPRP